MKVKTYIHYLVELAPRSCSGSIDFELARFFIGSHEWGRARFYLKEAKRKEYYNSDDIDVLFRELIKSG